MRAALVLLLVPLVALQLGQVVVDTFGGGEIATRRAAIIPYTEPPRAGPLYPVNVNNWWGLMNRQGDLVVYPDFDWTDHDHEQLVRVVAGNGRTGFVMGNGAWRIPPEFPYADRFAGGFAVVGDGEGRFGYIDKRGGVRVPIQLEGALRFRENVAAVMIDGKVGYIDSRGDVLVSPQFRRGRSFHDGVAAVESLPEEGGDAGVLGYIDKRGRWVFRDRERRFTALGDFSENHAKARVGDRWGYLDSKFRLRIDPVLEGARDFVGGVAAVKIDGLWGYINKRGDLTIPPRFEEADDFDDTLARVKLDGRYGYVNKRGELVIAATLTEAWPFFRSLARAGTGEFTYIDVAGRMHWSPEAARLGFVNRRAKEDIALRHRQLDRYNRDLAPPPPRPARPEPYPPDYLYEEVLPQPSPVEVEAEADDPAGEPSSAG